MTLDRKVWAPSDDRKQFSARIDLSRQLTANDYTVSNIHGFYESCFKDVLLYWYYATSVGLNERIVQWFANMIISTSALISLFISILFSHQVFYFLFNIFYSSVDVNSTAFIVFENSFLATYMFLFIVFLTNNFLVIVAFFYLHPPSLLHCVPYDEWS